MAEQIDITERLRCWYCDGLMYFRLFTTCFGETAEFFECGKCHFTLARDFVDTYGPERPTAA